jgi:hypothetical protein
MAAVDSTRDLAYTDVVTADLNLIPVEVRGRVRVRDGRENWV